MKWSKDPQSKRMEVREDGCKRCRECGKISPPNVFEDFRHFSDCVTWGVKPKRVAS